MPVPRRMILLALAFAGFLLIGPYASSQAASSTASPSLKETTDWLASHLVTVNHVSRETVVSFKAKKGQEPKEVDRQTINTRESITGASFQGCVLTLTQTIKGDDYTYITTSTVPFDRLTQALTKTEIRQGSKKADGLDSSETTIVPASFTAVTLDASTNVISFKRRSTGSVPLSLDLQLYEGNNTSLDIASDDAEMPARLVKAFNHAIQLCHVDSKPEPF